MRVEIAGLSSKPELNGRIGKAVSFETARSRYAVELPNGERLALKAANLSLAPDDPVEEAASEMTPEEEGLEVCLLHQAHLLACSCWPHSE